jgi:hypothetical protein
MASVAPHLHISGISGVIQALFVIAIFGALTLAAKHFEGHPLADGFRNIYGAN